MLEHLLAQHGVDAAAGVQHQILAQPSHAAGEEHEHHQRHAQHDERALGVMGDDLVDDDLGEERCGQADQLDGEAGEQYIPPDALVAQQFGHEPGEAEGLFLGFGRCGFADRFGNGWLGLGHQQQYRCRLGAGGVERHGLRGRLAGFDPSQGVVTVLDDQRRGERDAGGWRG